MERQAFSHLMHRAGFGPSPAEWARHASLSSSEWVALVLADSAESRDLDVMDGERRPDPRDRQRMNAEQKQAQREANQRALLRLNAAWIDRMAGPYGQLREKMTLFWHDHFACRLPIVHLAQPQNNTLRRHALGSFRDLLFAISQDPGMLFFLNNQQNRKEQPNENFARELLELFTLGQGHYSEQDIREAARAFTGWGFNLAGEFVFRRWQHDTGSKTFRGHSGNFTGEDILNLVLDDRQTAHFLTEKLYRYLVHPEPDAEVVAAWAKQFYESDYDIAGLLATMLHSDHFYAPRNRAMRIKAPVEYLAGLIRKFALHFESEEGMLVVQRILGQVLLQPPSVAGWPEGRACIDGSSLLFRLQLPRVLLAGQTADFVLKPAFAGDEEPLRVRRAMESLRASANWGYLQQHVPLPELPDYLLGCSPAVDLPARMRALARPDAYERSALALVCSPEFQLC